MFFLFLSISNANAESILLKACDNIDKVAALIAPVTVNPFQTLQITNLGPVPGVILALIQPESVILDLCNMYKNLSLAKGMDKIRLVGDYTNVLTDNKFSEHISFTRDTLDLGDNLNNMNKMNQPALDKFRSLTPRINSYLGSINDYYKYNTGDRIDNISSRNERENNMNEIARSSKELAIYGSVLNCDTANNRPNNSSENLYSRDTSLLLYETEIYRSDVDYLLDRLKSMGIKFNNGNSGYNNYLRDLYNLYNLAVEYTGSIKNYKEKTNTQTGQGSIRQKEVSRSYQVVSVVNNGKMFDDIEKKYKPKWNDYIASNMASQTKGLLDNRGGRIQEEFYDYSFECRDSLVYETVKKRNPDYFISDNDPRRGRALQEESQGCRAQNKRDVSKIKNLFTEYVEILRKSLISYKNSQAQIWTIDSYYNGSFRSFTKGVVGSDPNGPIREEVSCSKNINLAEQANIKLKLKLESTTLRQKALEEMVKEGNKEDLARAVEKDSMAREDRALLIKQENERRNAEDYSQYFGRPEYSGEI